MTKVLWIQTHEVPGTDSLKLRKQNGGNDGELFIEYRFSVWDDENVLDKSRKGRSLYHNKYI